MPTGCISVCSLRMPAMPPSLPMAPTTTSSMWATRRLASGNLSTSMPSMVLTRQPRSWRNCLNWPMPATWKPSRNRLFSTTWRAHLPNWRMLSASYAANLDSSTSRTPQCVPSALKTSTMTPMAKSVLPRLPSSPTSDSHSTIAGLNRSTNSTILSISPQSVPLRLASVQT